MATVSPIVEQFCDLLIHGFDAAGHEALTQLFIHEEYGNIIMFPSYLPRTPKSKRPAHDFYFVSVKGVHAINSETQEESTTVLSFKDGSMVPFIALSVVGSIIGKRPLDWPECQTCLSERQEQQPSTPCLN